MRPLKGVSVARIGSFPRRMRPFYMVGVWEPSSAFHVQGVRVYGDGLVLRQPVNQKVFLREFARSIECRPGRSCEAGLGRCDLAIQKHTSKLEEIDP